MFRSRHYFSTTHSRSSTSMAFFLRSIQKDDKLVAKELAIVQSSPQLPNAKGWIPYFHSTPILNNITPTPPNQEDRFLIVMIVFTKQHDLVGHCNCPECVHHRKLNSLIWTRAVFSGCTPPITQDDSWRLLLFTKILSGFTSR
jgi:hypothetical protein